ncbi:Uma2 family endonuclease [Streptomyces broussonetiae]|uniref:Uma2 family endonuclease n=1 Tax=Streptomyces broussonetiae TaxID=2686304 RepID=A0A6I6N4L6_9ACTN|nr:Uma2 family endonuclease [Streptomyces broussonetiae]QHA06452.1 Uma2 family endonuclease [Streptomyces broussonetiae]
MSALTVSQDPDQNWDDLVRYWEEMEWPEGSKVEIIEGIITVSPTPAFRHNIIAARVQRRLYSVIPDEWEVFQTLSIAVPSRLGMFIPDLLVVPVHEPPETDSYLPAALAELVVEVTSKSNARHDRVSKAAAYATAGIPLYLLIDRWAPGGPTATLYGEPKGDVYRVLSAVKFGDPIRLPAPFDVTIDTGEFPVD